MDAPYEELRKAAAAKRDKTIETAKQEYRVAVRRIRSLHKLVTGESHPAIRTPRRVGNRTLREVLLEILPTDRAFTVAQACEWVWNDELGLQYKENTIRTMIVQLGNADQLHKVGRKNGHVLWARTEANITPQVFGTLTTCEIAEQIIRERGPLRLMEIVLIMKERGYRPKESNNLTYGTMRRSMTRISGRFVRDDKGRWNAANKI